MKTALRVFYSNVYLHGTQNIPATGPVVLVANHASSVMDAVILGVFLQRPVHFFARGDMFKNIIASWFMKQVNMMPVHHHQSGRNTIANNDESFEYAKQLLLQGEVILFFPEGTSHTEHQLYSFKKGVFRIAFDFLQKNNWLVQLPCVPVGITYDHPTKFNKAVTIHVGQPFLLNTYQQLYNEKEAACLLQCSKDAWNAVEPLTLHINNKNRLPIAETALQLLKNDLKSNKHSWIDSTSERFLKMQDAVTRINRMEEFEWVEFEKDVNNYQSGLQQYNLDDEIVCSQPKKQQWLQRLLLAMLSPIAIVGFLLNALPILITKRIADTKVYRVDFYSWILVAVSAFLYFFWLIILWVGFSFISWVDGLAVVAITILTGWILKHYLQWWAVVQIQQYQKKVGSTAMQSLQQMRQSVLKHIVAAR